MQLFRRFRRPDASAGAALGVETFAELRELVRVGAGVGAQREAIAGVLTAHGAPEDAVARYVAAMRDGVALFEAPASGGDARCRLGGRPLLPAGEPWPTDHRGVPLSFVAALHLGSVPSVAPLPAAGTLLVFWDLLSATRETVDTVTATRVHLAPPDATLVPAEPPAGTHAFGPIALDPVAMPFPGDPRALTGDDVPADVPGAELHACLLDEYPHSLLGVSRDVQGPVLDEVPSWLGAGLPGTRERFSPAELAGEGWALLAQIDETTGLQLGDVGALYVLVPAADLAEGRVDRAMGVLQC